MASVEEVLHTLVMAWDTLDQIRAGKGASELVNLITSARPRVDDLERATPPGCSHLLYRASNLNETHYAEWFRRTFWYPQELEREDWRTHNAKLVMALALLDPNGFIPWFSQQQFDKMVEQRPSHSGYSARLGEWYRRFDFAAELLLVCAIVRAGYLSDGFASYVKNWQSREPHLHALLANDQLQIWSATVELVRLLSLSLPLTADEVITADMYRDFGTVHKDSQLSALTRAWANIALPQASLRHAIAVLGESYAVSAQLLTEHSNNAEAMMRALEQGPYAEVLRTLAYVNLGRASVADLTRASANV